MNRPSPSCCLIFSSEKTGSVDALFERVYGTLRDLARAQRREWQGDYTLNTTALVHEAYLKLVDGSRTDFDSRARFLNIASKVMRHLLIDYARKRGAEKRGGSYRKESLDVVQGSLASEFVMTEERAADLLALDEALRRLAEVDEREARVVECRFFAGMTTEETASSMGLSAMTVKRDWAMALAWLRREMIEDS